MTHRHDSVPARPDRGLMDPDVRAIMWASLRSVVLIAIAVLLVLVVFPAVLGAAGPQVANGL